MFLRVGRVQSHVRPAMSQYCPPECTISKRTFSAARRIISDWNWSRIFRVITLSAISQAFGFSQQVGIYRGGTQGLADLAHRLPQSIEEGTAGILHQLQSFSNCESATKVVPLAR